MPRIVLVGLLLLGVLGCENEAEVREDLPPAPTVEAALTHCFGSVPEIPTGASGVSGSLFDRAKRFARSGSGRFVEPPTQRELETIGDSTIAWMKEQYPETDNRASVERVRSVASRLIAALPESSKDPYTFVVLAADQINAFMSTGGRGAVLEPLLAAMPSDDALAFVLGHELAHGELMHGAEKVHAAKVGWKLGSKVDEWLESDRAPQIVSDITGKLLGAVYDQDQEWEADRLGMCLMWRAGFDPAGGPEAMRALGGAEHAAPREGVRRIAYDIKTTHPAGGDRIAYMETLIAMIRATHGE
jgi:predicted Zn-dependent protease